MSNTDSKLDKTFFQHHPIVPTQCGIVTIMRFITWSDPALVDEAAAELQQTDSEQHTQITAEAAAIRALETPEALVNRLRKPLEGASFSLLIQKIKPMADAVAPILIRRFCTNRTETYLENSSIILYNLENSHRMALFAKRDEIQDPYGQALLCLLLGLGKIQDDAVDAYLLAKYREFQALEDQPKSNKPEAEHFILPLMALHMLHNDYDPIKTIRTLFDFKLED